MFYIKERVSKAKLIQIVSGANKFLFWMVSFVLDYIVFFLIAMLYILVMAAYQKEGLSSFEELLRITIILLIFGFAVLPYTYVLSFAFTLPTTGLVTTAITYIVSGTLFYTVYFVLISELLGLQWVGEPLGWTFLIFPHFSLTKAMSNLNVMQSTIASCDSQCATVQGCTIDLICNNSLPCDLNPPPPQIPNLPFFCSLQESCCSRNYFNLGDDGIGIMLIALVIVALTSFVVLFIIEFRVIQTIIVMIRKPKM
jgi:ATP-binding cassette subfamily A (ABC1) protein 3